MTAVGLDVASVCNTRKNIYLDYSHKRLNFAIDKGVRS